MRVQELGPSDGPSIRSLVEASGLPSGDLDQPHIRFLGSRDEAGLAGVVGLELFGETGLLRSLAVRSDLRGVGLGGQLVRAAEDAAISQGATNLFILTTTAETFFGRRGYAQSERVTSPPVILPTAELTSNCPPSAAFIRK